MDQKSNEIQQIPAPCRNGCGFFSSNASDGLCSVCYKNKIEKQQHQETLSTSKSTDTATSTVSTVIEQINQVKS